MKTHKFLIIVGQSAFYIDELGDNPIVDQIVYNEDQYMRVIKCHHENLEDNIITVPYEYGDVDLIKDTRGRLWYAEDVWTKEKVIAAFE